MYMKIHLCIIETAKTQSDEIQVVIPRLTGNLLVNPQCIVVNVDVGTEFGMTT